MSIVHKIGIDEYGCPLVWDFIEARHSVVAGQTRSGKSATAYVVNAAASDDSRVKVVGIDPSGILLGPHPEARSTSSKIHLGTSDPEHAVQVVEALVRIMDYRNANLLRQGHDKIPDLMFRAEFPIYLCVLEEYAGTLEWIKLQDATRKPADKLHPRLVGAVGRLLREGAKAGMRVLTIIQRPEASTLHDRAQYSRRISHRLDNADSVRMLFDAATPEQTSALMNAPPGVGCIQEAGTPMRRFRTDYIEYPAYTARVRA